MSVKRAFLALVSLFVAGTALADGAAPLSLAADAAEPYLPVLRARGAAFTRPERDAAAADLRILDAGEALTLRSAGVALKAIYVVGRDQGRYDVLVVREDVLASRGADVARLVAEFEGARQWVRANPGQAAELVRDRAGEASAQRLAARDTGVARPGPALEEALSRSADRTRAHALLDDGPLRAAMRAAPRPDTAIALLK